MMVEIPERGIAEFPDEMPPEEVTAVIQRTYPELAPKKADLSGVKLDPYQQADLESMSAGRGKAETGMESGTELTTALVQGAGDAAAKVTEFVTQTIPQTIGQATTDILNMPEMARYLAGQALGLETEYQPTFKPGVQIIPSPEKTPIISPNQSPFLQGLVDDLASQITALTTPDNIGLMLATGGTGVAGKQAATETGKVLAAYFGGLIGTELPGRAKQAFDVLNDPNATGEEKGAAVAQAGGPALLGALLVHSAAKTGAPKAEPKTPVEAKAEQIAPLAPLTAEALKQTAKEGGKDVVKLETKTPEATPVQEAKSQDPPEADKARYRELDAQRSKMIEDGSAFTPDQSSFTPEYMATWKELETIKNRHGGMPPETAHLAKPLEALKPEAPVESVLGPEPTPKELVGMGGAVASEFELSAKTPTSIKNAQVDIERAKRGLPEVVQPARRSFGEVWDSAMARIDNDPPYPDRLINELRENPRALTDLEDATLLHRQVDLQNEYGKATRALAQAFDDGRMEDVALEKAKVDFISNQLLDLYNIGKKVGTETGRGLSARRMMANEDFTLASLELQKRAAKGGNPLTDAERAELSKIADEYKVRNDALEKRLYEKDKIISDMEVARALDQVERDAKTSTQSSPYIISVAERIVASLDKRADAARARLREKMGRTSAGVDPTILADLAEIGASHIGHIGLDFVKWSTKMVEDIGEWAKPHLESVFKQSQELIDNAAAKLGDKKSVPKVAKAVKKQGIKEEGDAIGKAIQKKVEAGEQDDISGLVQKLARTFVELGIKDRNELIDAVHAELKRYIPDISRRDTMDAISGYGKFKQLTKDDISVQLRDLKGQMQQVGKLEDMQSGQAPKKTGVERRIPSDEERRLIKQVEEAKKKGGYVVTNPETQLRSALQSIKTRLENTIADLEHEISTRTRIVKDKTTPPTSPEIELLRSRRDELRAQRDELFGKRELTDEQRVKLAMSAVEKSIAEYERRIKSGELITPKAVSKTPNTPELQAARSRRDALKEQLQELRDLDPAIRAQKERASLEAQKRTLEKVIAEKERQLKVNDLQPKGRAVNRPAHPELERLNQRRDQLSDQLAEARKKPESQKYAESLNRRLEAMRKAIKTREEQIAASDLSSSSPPKQVNRPLPPELEQAKQRLEALNEQLRQMRKDAVPKKSPEELALQAYKTRTKHRIADLEERLAQGNFAKKTPREIKFDQEALRLKYQLELVKRQWYEGLMKDRLANRTVPQKVMAGLGEVVNTFRAIMTSFDLSAVLRQGGFVVMGHPIRAAKVFPAMFRALKSKEGQFKVDQEILQRPNYPLYEQSKLYLSEHGQKLSQMEEAYMSRWAEKIPGVAASQRAYTTFLNKLRADSFDAMARTLSRTGELTPNEAKAIANFINVATGRGNVGMKENALVGLNTVFFAPRYVASRLQLITGQPLYQGTARTRALIASEYARYLIGVSAVYALAQFDGAEIEIDPRSSDFGKLRYGETRLDPLSGLQQVTVLMTRLTTGETTNLKGKTIPIRGEGVPYGGSDAADVIARFLRTKLAPLPGAIVNLLSQENVVGQPVTPQSTATDLLVPLAFRDIYKAVIEQGIPRGTAFGILSLFGMGLQTYDQR